MNDKGGINLAVMVYSITLDEILEANYVGDCLLGIPLSILASLCAWEADRIKSG